MIGLDVNGARAVADIVVEINDDYTKILGWKIVRVEVYYGKWVAYTDMSLDCSVDPLILSDQIHTLVADQTDDILSLSTVNGYV
jgi:hypothetical protein